MKKIIVVLIFIGFAFGVYYFQNDAGYETFSYRDDFNSFNDDFWYAATWDSDLFDIKQVDVNRGIINLTIEEEDAGPYLVSKPILLEPGATLRIKRRVQLKPTGQAFAGALALLETEDKGIIPSVLNKDGSRMGNGVVLVEYVTQVPEGALRPGSNTFRVIPRTWHFQNAFEIKPSVFGKWFSNNYALVSPKYNQWIEEELIYETKTGLITYVLDGVSYQVKGPIIKSDRVRLYMHGYGFGTGHQIQMDWIDIRVD